MAVQILQPFDRTVIAEIEADDVASLDRKLEAARKAFFTRTSWLPLAERVAILTRVADRIAAERDRLALQIAREGGKPLSDALVEVDRAADGVRNAYEALRSFGGTEIAMGYTSASDGRRAFTIREPIGIVAAISAFNHPLNLIVHQVAPAIAVGAPVIIKPAHQTPLSCRDFVSIVHQCGLPEPWCQMIYTDDLTLAEKFAIDPRIAFLSFIGSARVGWSLRRKVADGVRVALEHGGTAPAIIAADADLDMIISALAKGSFYHSGQVCVSTQRIFVHAHLADEFIDRFSNRVGNLRVGDPTDYDTEVGPLISPHETDRVEQWVEEARMGGAQILLGGRLSTTTLKPAIVLNPPQNSRLATGEVFGPVVTIQRFTALDEAIAIANDTDFAFQASIFTRDLETALAASERLNAGAVLINDHTAFRTDWMPFAGLRRSGYGIGGIPYTMRDFTHEKMIVLRR
ncbi:MAG: aldehyde dehydrogenase family protein [Acidiphilium sp.]|nr:aldehyde dehydrogenase family protein [Acidiphilium sp.]